VRERVKGRDGRGGKREVSERETERTSEREKRERETEGFRYKCTQTEK
jgi:hypothetical protein